MELSKNGKSVYLRVGFWLQDNGSIHLTGPGVPGFHVTINKDPVRKNGHRTLYNRLAKCLREMGAPSPQLRMTKVGLVPQEGFEPPTPALRMRCSTD
jgi:hypothetical protein